MSENGLRMKGVLCPQSLNAAFPPRVVEREGVAGLVRGGECDEAGVGGGVRRVAGCGTLPHYAANRCPPLLHR